MPTLRALLALVLWVATATLVLSQSPTPEAKAPKNPLTEDERIFHALSRLTFGPRPADVTAVKTLGLSKWIDQQLNPETLTEAELEEELKGFKTLGLSPKQLTALEAPEVEGGKKRDRNQINAQTGRELRHAVVLRSFRADRQLKEVLAHFWRNHFNVDLAKDSVIYTATHFEEHALRPHLFGKFGDMLLATARHPAMLIYLDNALSRKPPPKSELKNLERRVRRQTGSREAAAEQVEIAKQAGLNENYARELMELHTLGVDNGYVQKDVVEVARAFTGWTVDFEKSDVGFLYRDDVHDMGPKTLMGKPLPEGKKDDGIIEGEAVIKRLAAHDHTAEYVARKMVRFFVNDDPPGPIVDAAVRAFKANKGELRAVVKAIVSHPEFFDRAHYRAKFKTPMEFVISVLRATNATVVDPDVVEEAIGSLGMRIYGCEDPTGFSDTAEAWRDPGVMALRWRFAVSLTEGRVSGMLIPASFYEGLPEDPLELTKALTQRILPSGLGAASAAVLERVVFQDVQNQRADDAKGRRLLARKIVGILLGTPEFQQQ